MSGLLERRFKRMTEAYRRLLYAYIWGNRRDRDTLIHEAEMLIGDAEWGFFPPITEDKPIEAYRE
ncbi:hypothetical protein LCGC14_0942230 [marine sediment metagenome]|uniref:Uncharacterized protein n=1 Tax=marine sediment metagenome TaxID=412755 RepID=A0A0F9NPD8_9ZZZZ